MSFYAVFLQCQLAVLKPKNYYITKLKCSIDFATAAAFIRLSASMFFWAIILLVVVLKIWLFNLDLSSDLSIYLPLLPQLTYSQFFLQF